MKMNFSAHNLQVRGLKVVTQEGYIIANCNGYFGDTVLSREYVKMFTAAPDLLEQLSRSQKWIGKLIADQPEHDDTGIKIRAQRQYKANKKAIAKATV